jgi:disulfide bond formation protein DsbB
MLTLGFNLLRRQWLWLALIASAAMLGAAHAFEQFGGFAPCHLCLQQREVYWVAIGVSVAGLALQRFERLRPLILAALALVFLAGAAIAIQQAGAEWKFWSAPEGCSGARAATAADLAALLSNKPMSTPRCDEAAWRMLGLSMAGWNALASLALAAMSGLAVRKG